MKTEEIAQVVCDAFSSIEIACVNAKEQILKLAVPEHVIETNVSKPLQPKLFSEDIFEKLIFSKETGKGKMGEFEKATLENNNSAVFNKAKAILLQKKATIDKKTRLKHTGFGYWLYFKTPDAIYRQRIIRSY